MKLCDAAVYDSGQTKKRHESLVIYDDYFGAESGGKCPLCEALDKIEDLYAEKAVVEEERDDIQSRLDALGSDYDD